MATKKKLQTQFTPKQMKAQAKSKAKSDKNASKALAKMSNNQQGIVDYGKHQPADWRHTTNDQVVKYPKFTDQQLQVLQNINASLNGGINNLSLPGRNKYSFQPTKEEAQRRFSQETVPSIAHRFNALGGPDSSGGALSSGALYSQLGSAASQLDSQLAALEQEFGLRQQGLESNNLFNLLGAGLSPQFDLGVIPGQDSGNRQGWNYVKKALPGAIAGGLTGGVPGAIIGGLGGLGAPEVGNALQQRWQSPTAQSNVSGFTPQQGIGFGYNSNLGTGGINNSITNGYANNMMPSSNQYLFPTQF